MFKWFFFRREQHRQHRRLRALEKIAELQQLQADGQSEELKLAPSSLDPFLFDTPTLRLQLGRAYFEAGFEVMAGLYWFAEEPTSPEMLDAVEAFKRSCRFNASEIMSQLRHVYITGFQVSAFGKQRLDELKALDSLQRPAPSEVPREPRRRVLGCGLALALVLFAFIVGLYTLFTDPQLPF